MDHLQYTVRRCTHYCIARNVPLTTALLQICPHHFAVLWPHQPPTVVTRILGEFGDLETIAPTYTEEEAAVMLQVNRVLMVWK